MRKTMGVCLAIAASAAMVLLNAQTWQWAKGYGAPKMDGIKAIATDAQGNVYVTGYYTGHVSIGAQALDSIGGLDFFVAKFDRAGAIQWAKYAGTSGGGGNDSAFDKDEVGTAIALDAQGNIYCGGFVSPRKSADVVDFGNTQRITYSNGMSFGDPFVVKYNSTGVAQWAKIVGYASSGTDAVTGIAVGPNGFIYISGYFYGNALSVPGLTTVTGRFSTADMLFEKIDPATGTIKWAKAIGARGNDYAWDVTADQTNSIYLAGEFTDTLLQRTLQPAGTVYGRSVNKTTDACILKYDTTGTYKLSKVFGDSGYDCAKGITLSPSGNIYVTGRIVKRATQGTTVLVTTTGSYSAVTVKFSGTDMSTLWAKAIGDINSIGMSGLDIAVSGNRAIIGGIVSGRLNFGGASIAPMTSTYESMIAAYDTLGAEKWATMVGGNGPDSSAGVSMVGDSVYVGGAFKSDTLKFGSITPIVNSGLAANYCNMFLARMTQPPSTIIFDLSSSRKLAPITLRSGAELQVITKGLSGSAMVRLMDAQGRVAAMRKIGKDGTASLSISALSNGMYLVQVVNGNAVLATQKCLIGAR